MLKYISSNLGQIVNAYLAIHISISSIYSKLTFPSINMYIYINVEVYIISIKHFVYYDVTI